jgi:hypothetical protein
MNTGLLAHICAIVHPCQNSFGDLTVILLLEQLHKLFLSEFLYSYAGNVSNDVADA